jgi:hypothetical protein
MAFFLVLRATRPLVTVVSSKTSGTLSYDVSCSVKRFAATGGSGEKAAGRPHGGCKDGRRMEMAQNHELPDLSNRGLVS